MREVFREVIREQTLSLPYIQTEVIGILGRIRNEIKIPHLGYVAGIMYSDGPQHVEANISRLLETTEILNNQYDFPLFCSPHIFTSQIYTRLSEMRLPPEVREPLFYNFWREILKSGHVTDIFLTEDWRRSKGATDEYQTALQIGLTIHDLENFTF